MTFQTMAGEGKKKAQTNEDGEAWGVLSGRQTPRREELVRSRLISQEGDAK